MELKDFVKETLVEIALGVSNAQKSGGPALINPRIKARERDDGRVFLVEDASGRGTKGERILDFIEFDVAVTIDKGTDTKGKIGVLFGAVNLTSQGGSTSNDSSTSRVKFNVPVSFDVDCREGE